MESALEMKKGLPRRHELGQATVIFALLVPAMALFLVGVLDYMVTNAQVMEVVAAADLAAHAGAQEVLVNPDGTLANLAEGQAVAELYFRVQAPSEAQLLGTACGQIQGQPACQVWAQMPSSGYLIQRRQVQVSAVGYLAPGVTRGDQ